MPTRRVLKSVSHNLLESLLSGPYSLPNGDILVHMGSAARSTNATVIKADLLKGTIYPVTAGTPELQRLAATAAERLRDLIVGAGLPSTSVRAGTLSAEYLPIGTPELGREGRKLQAVTVTLEDDLGRQHVFNCPASWFTAPPTPSPGGPRPLPARGVRSDTPVTRLLDWLERFLPRFW
jgi:hypothetical protein